MPYAPAAGAVELAVGHACRGHGDVDIAILRRDQLTVRGLLRPSTRRPTATAASNPGQSKLGRPDLSQQPRSCGSWGSSAG